MNSIIQATLKNLQKTEKLLSILSNDMLSSASVPPYNSSIGSHIRHVLDFYDCLFVEGNRINLTARKRNMEVETDCEIALSYYHHIVEKLNLLKENDLEKLVVVTDNLGLGNTEIRYTFSGLLAQANSHTIHHYAIINYILEGLGCCINDEDFGYNPTTPKKVTSN
mgnify:CR=1 FL=1